MKRWALTLLSLAGACAYSSQALAGERVSLEPVARGLTAPNLLTHAGDGSGRLFITDQPGRIRIVGADGRLLERPFLDVSSKIVPLGANGPGTFDERGLLGLAFHPDYESNGRFFIYYSAPVPPAIAMNFEENDIPRGEMNFSFRGVDFEGGTVGEQGEPFLYGSPPSAFQIPAEGTATVTLPETFVIVRIYFVHRPDESPGTVQIFDELGQPRGGEIESSPATTPGDPANYLRLQNTQIGIRSLRFRAGSGNHDFTLFVDDLSIFRWNHESHVSEYRVSPDDPNLADADSERILMTIDEPEFNHNAGMLAFGPDDGYLYIATGDGGAGNDVGYGHTPKLGNAQDLTKPLGKLLRIDVDSGQPYGIPSDNPFLEVPGARPEIWAYGLRNPFRFSFDMGGNHDLFLADVGQLLFEEVSIVTAGANMGWNIREGFHCFNPGAPNNPPPECPKIGRRGDELVDPIIEFPHAAPPDVPQGISIIGGYRYRGSEFVALKEKLVFGDWSRAPFNGPANGSLFSSTETAPGQWNLEELRVANHVSERIELRVLGFGQDPQGEVYVCTSNSVAPFGDTGAVFKLTPPPDCRDVRSLRAKCRGTTIVVKVRTRLPEGAMLNVANNGVSTPVTIDDRGRATVRYADQEGERTIVVAECPDKRAVLTCP